MAIETVIQSDIEAGPAESQLPPATWAAGVDGIGDLFAATSFAETLDVVVRLAWRAFRADAASVLLVGADGAAPTAASGTEARRADALQIDHHQGPGLQAIKGRQPVVSPELRSDGRWRFWAPQAADLGFRSVLSLALIDGDPFGAITLYSDRPSNFGTEALAPGLEFAHQASLAIVASLEPGQARTATSTDAAQVPNLRLKRSHVGPNSGPGVLRRPPSPLTTSCA